VSFKRAIHLDAPVEAVFELFRNPANWQQFAAKGLVYKNVTLTPEGVGTTYEWVAKVVGVSISGSNVFTEFVPDKRITDRCSRAFEGTWTYTFEPDGSGTKLTYENQPASFWRLPPLNWVLDRATARTHEPVMAELQAKMATR
jgi:ligand-binding SRPBCC domain-containing protein